MLEPAEEVDAIASAVMDAAFEVHRTLGPGFLETVYDQALAVELSLRAIPFVRQHSLPITCKGHPVGEGRADFLVGNCLMVELKAAEKLLPVHQAQVISYLKASGSTLGLLINFHEPLLKNGFK